MLFENDFIKRLVRQFAEVAARLAGLRREGRNEEALEEIDAAYRQLFRMEPSFIESLDAGSVARLVRDGELLETYAKLLEEEALVHDATGDTARARSRRARADAVRAAAGPA